MKVRFWGFSRYKCDIEIKQLKNNNFTSQSRGLTASETDFIWTFDSNRLVLPHITNSPSFGYSSAYMYIQQSVRL